MPDHFDQWKRLQDRQGSTDKFVTKARHVSRYRGPKPASGPRLEAQRDRMIFLVVVGILVTVGVIAAIAVLKSKSGG